MDLNDLDLAHEHVLRVRQLAKEPTALSADTIERMDLQILHLASALQDVIEHLRSLQSEGE